MSPLALHPSAGNTSDYQLCSESFNFNGWEIGQNVDKNQFLWYKPDPDPALQLSVLG